jgi:hypothetical protein
LSNIKHNFHQQVKTKTNGNKYSGTYFNKAFPRWVYSVWTENIIYILWLTLLPVNQLHYWNASILQGGPEPPSLAMLRHTNFHKKFTIMSTLDFNILKFQKTCT